MNVAFVAPRRRMRRQEESELHRGPYRTDLARFPALTGAKSDAASHPNLQLRCTVLRFWSGFPMWQVTSAQHWGQFLTFEGKICSLFGAFTTRVAEVVNWPKVRTNQDQRSEFGLKVGTRRISFVSDRFWSGSFKARSRNLSCIFCLKNVVYSTE